VSDYRLENYRKFAPVVRVRVASTSHFVWSSVHRQRLGAAGVGCSWPGVYIDADVSMHEDSRHEHRPSLIRVVASAPQCASSLPRQTLLTLVRPCSRRQQSRLPYLRLGRHLRKSLQNRLQSVVGTERRRSARMFSQEVKTS